MTMPDTGPRDRGHWRRRRMARSRIL